MRELIAEMQNNAFETYSAVYNGYYNYTNRY